MVCLPSASREKDNKPFAIAVTTVCVRGVSRREPALSLVAFFPLRYSFSISSFFFWHQSTIAFPPCFYSSRSFTPSISLSLFTCVHVEQSLDAPIALFGTVVVRLYFLSPFLPLLCPFLAMNLNEQQEKKNCDERK